MGRIKTLNPKADKILTLAMEHGFITSEEIEMAIQCSPRIVRNYVKFLSDIRFVDKIKLIDFVKHPAIIVPLIRAYRYLESSSKEVRVIRKFYKSDFVISQLYHVKTSIQVRLVFESHPAVLDYRPTKVIEYYDSLEGKRVDRYKYKIVDAEVIFKTAEGEKKAGIKIELIEKGRQTYRNYMYYLNNRWDLDCICWVCGNEKILKTILKVLKDMETYFREPEKHVLTVWDKFKQIKFNEPIWTNINDEKLFLLTPTNTELQTAKMMGQTERKKNVFEIWLANNKKIPFKVKRETWHPTTYFIVEKIEISEKQWEYYEKTGNLYGEAWGKMYLRGGLTKDEIIKLEGAGCYQWELID